MKKSFAKLCLFRKSSMVLTLLFAGSWIRAAEIEVIPPIPAIEDLEAINTTAVDDEDVQPTVLATSEGEGVRGRVNASNLNVRSGPSSDKYEIVTTIRREAEVLILGKKNDWYCIAYPAHHPCYIRVKAIDGEIPVSIGPDGVTMPVKGDDIALHVRPWPKSTVVGRLETGDIVTILGRRGKFFKITPPASAKAWVAVKYIEMLEEADELPSAKAPKPGVVPGLGKAVAKAKAMLKKKAEAEQPEPSHRLFAEFMRKFKGVDESPPQVPDAVAAAAEMQEVEEQLAAIREETARRKDKIKARMPEKKVEQFVVAKQVGEQAVSGWVEFTGYGARRPAAYRLVKGGEVLFLLRSGKYNLRKYINKRVEVDGAVQAAPGWEANVLVVTTVRLLDEGPAFLHEKSEVKEVREVVKDEVEPADRNRVLPVVVDKEVAGEPDKDDFLPATIDTN